MHQYPFGLNEIREICFNDEKEMHDLFKLSKTSIEEDIISIRQSIEAQDIHTLREKIHNIKGMIFVLGNSNLNEIFVKANEMLSQKEITDKCKVDYARQCIEESDGLINQFIQWTELKNFR